LRLEHLGDAVAPALLAGGDGDVPPVLVFALALLRIKLHDRALREHRDDARDAELRRLLHDEVHAFAARHSLQQRHVERRLAFDGIVPQDTRARALPGADERGRVLAAAPVEQRERRARVQPQHAHQVFDGLFG
jgi:hypothetical protein